VWAPPGYVTGTRERFRNALKERETMTIGTGNQDVVDILTADHH